MICVAIPCLPRSGSSMTAGIVSRLGVDMGPVGLSVADRNNPAGYYEDWRFSRFHRWRSSLENRDDTWRRRLRMPPVDPQFTPAQAARYRRLVAACEAGGTDWGVKDPELTYYLPRLAEAATCELRLLVPRRPVDESLASGRAAFGAAFGGDASEARAALAEYADRLDGLVAGWAGPKMTFAYHDCLREPARIVGEIAGFLGRATTPEAVASVSPGLRNHAGR
jgi:hypothetical protein